jgi:hypothetical protein
MQRNDNNDASPKVSADRCELYVVRPPAMLAPTLPALILRLQYCAGSTATTFAAIAAGLEQSAAIGRQNNLC